jgi:hypothetical protein
MPRALIDAKINAALQQRCYHAMLTTAFEKVAQDVIDLNRCAFAQIAIHRRGQRRSGRRQRAGILWRKASHGLCPHAVVIAAHSFKIARARSAPLGTPTMSPILPRAKQVMAPRLAIYSHFSHIACVISEASRASKPAPCSVASSAAVRAVAWPLLSP